MTSRIKCAIYTRKSSEEGLDQSFNSLDAQREACEAYVLSQRHEGWVAVSTKYDDGGFSGGNMDRPGLKKLMTDIAEGKVNSVVVYKVDRLTRSLADFAKLVEQFDSKGVTFVSVTQQFNTTTSMGRLTLNVLLSFAQFEREVTGERIRDKIAASKRKGMWMGGRVPLGYDLRDRRLYVNADEAEIVRRIFREYLGLRTVPALTAHLEKSGIRSKVRIGPGGAKTGGQAISRGAVYQLLRNRIYVGQIEHGGAVYSGEHDAIIDRPLWDQVQSSLDENRQGKGNRSHRTSGSLLTGLLFAESGVRYIPTHTQKGGRRYHYYTSQAAMKGNQKGVLNARLPSAPLEHTVLERFRAFLHSHKEVLDVCKESDVPSADIASLLKVLKRKETEWDSLPSFQKFDVIRSVVSRTIIREDSLEIQIRSQALLEFLLGKAVPETATNSRNIRLSKFFRHTGQGNSLKMVMGSQRTEPTVSREAILKAIARARSWYESIAEGRAYSLVDLARKEGLTHRYIKNIFPLAVLGPQAVEMLLNGRGGCDPTLDSLMSKFPAGWDLQVALIARKC